MKSSIDLYERPSAAADRPSTTAKVSTVGDEIVPPQRQRRLIKEVYIFKRYGELIPPDSIFSVSGRTVLALPRLEQQLALQQRREAVGRRIDLARDEIVFGLAAYILDKYVQSGDAETKKFFDEASTYLPIAWSA